MILGRRNYWGCAFLALSLFLCSCVTPSSYYITGEKRNPVEYDRVTLYKSPPEHYEVIGYVEAWNEWDGLLVEENKAEKGSIKELKKTAGEMGANGVIPLSMEKIQIHIGGIEYAPNHYIVFSGWAVYVGEEQPPSYGERRSEGSIETAAMCRIYIEPPKEYELIGEISSRHKVPGLTSHHIIDTKSKTIGNCLEDLIQKAKVMGGNGLYIKNVKKESSYSIERFFRGGFGKPEPAEIYVPLFPFKVGGAYIDEKMYYVFSGEVIKASE